MYDRSLSPGPVLVGFCQLETNLGHLNLSSLHQFGSWACLVGVDIFLIVADSRAPRGLCQPWADGPGLYKKEHRKVLILMLFYEWMCGDWYSHNYDQANSANVMSTKLSV